MFEAFQRKRMKVVELKVYTEKVWQRFKRVFAHVTQLIVSESISYLDFFCYIQALYLP